MQGIIIENISGIYKVKAEGKVYNSTARGKMRKKEISPIVGDIVRLSVLNNNEAVIEEIYPRKSFLKRPKISNISQIFLVVSLKDPNPDLLLLDKQLVFSEFSKIKPIIILNKIDLGNTKEIEMINNIYEKMGYKIIETDAKNKIGIDKLKQELEGNINVFAGNSGVGKSTLVNAIFNEEKTLEGEISIKNKKGKNTTTATSLYEINSNTYIADTPGFSTFDVFEIDFKELDKYFIEFSEEISKCKYAGCSHIKEINCGIKEALDKKRINESRYQNYCKIYNELKECRNNGGKKW